MSKVLSDVKKLLGIAEDYEAFDTDVLIHVNSSMATLDQLAVTKPDRSSVDETTEWSDVIREGKDLESVRTYVYLNVRVIFDPPSTSYGIQSLKEIAKELAWRLNVAAEGET